MLGTLWEDLKITPGPRSCRSAGSPTALSPGPGEKNPKGQGCGPETWAGARPREENQGRPGERVPPAGISGQPQNPGFFCCHSALFQVNVQSQTPPHPHPPPPVPSFCSKCGWGVTCLFLSSIYKSRSGRSGPDGDHWASPVQGPPHTTPRAQECGAGLNGNIGRQQREYMSHVRSVSLDQRGGCVGIRAALGDSTFSRSGNRCHGQVPHRQALRRSLLGGPLGIDG